MSATRRCRGDDGWAVSEAVLLTPVALVVLGFLLLCGRLALAHLAVTSAAHDAARAASLERSYGDAARAALTATDANLSASCRPGSADARIVSPPAEFTAGGVVTVTVTCDADLAAVAIPGIPATKTITKSSTQVVDRYRSAP